MLKIYSSTHSKKLNMIYKFLEEDIICFLSPRLTINKCLIFKAFLRQHFSFSSLFSFFFFATSISSGVFSSSVVNFFSNLIPPHEFTNRVLRLYIKLSAENLISQRQPQLFFWAHIFKVVVHFSLMCNWNSK